MNLYLAYSKWYVHISQTEKNKEDIDNFTTSHHTLSTQIWHIQLS